jgi:site-specific recombinase XerC
VAGPENATVAQFAERFFRDIQERDRKDNTMTRRYLEKDIVPHIGAREVRQITAEDIRRVVWRKKAQGFDAAAGQIRGLLKRMLDYAVTCGLLSHNPVMALPMRHVYRAAARDRALTPEEIQLFLRLAQASNIRRQFKIALHLILMTAVTARLARGYLLRYKYLAYPCRRAITARDAGPRATLARRPPRQWPDHARASLGRAPDPSSLRP